jgi:hypothetical protein
MNKCTYNNGMDINEVEQILRAGTANDRPPIKVERVRELLGLTSKASATVWLWKLKEAGIVEWVANGEKGYGNWFWSDT